MITTTELKPSIAFEPYIRCYGLREFDTDGAELIKPIHAMHEFYMSFFLKGSTFLSFKEIKTITFSENTSWVLGLQTKSNGNLVFNGSYSVFTIQFKPNGFYKLFGLPMNSFTDQKHNSEDIFGTSIHLLKEQLNESKNLLQMGMHTEKFLLSFLIKRKVSEAFNQINFASLLILHHSGNINVQKLACEANMSLSRFEINFNEQVGVPPKLFARMTRFTKATNLKVLQPGKSWTSIAYDCNYHDQVHLIKDFKEFCGETPLAFFKHTPPPKENVNQIV
jgi:AraC-like DNA-binding protein